MKRAIIFPIFLTIFSGLFAQTPQRIVSLAPSLTKSLYYLDAADLVTGHTTYCHIAKDDDKEIVASAVSVNIEKVITLRPDLVLATTITNPETIEILKRAGIRTEVFPTARSFEELCEQFAQLGAMVGRKEVAEEVLFETRQIVEETRQAFKDQESLKFFFQIGARPLFSVLDNTFMDDYITFAGGRNIASGLSTGTLSREFVLVNNPDVIIIATMGIVGEEEMQIWEKYPTLSAVKSGRVFFVESDMACTPNPPDFAKTMQIIRQKLIK
ncbi:ABC transporter substrate-binding protein [Natronoflexus pectinivorans]|uniref:Iron complex transport system substrate-binding protein n=1 Tax=Natronoflexus pectinivorans TaxID=682526 RepID=A0A4R2GHW5_9BACT|nr:helical backbone metal receptor [Natronoflexus pectinivorans]TCO08037.1 iron complex transport system substrate-binding protein [Natronoflexus pectinivorans]